MAQARILMDGAYANLATCYKLTTDQRLVKLNGCMSPGSWLHQAAWLVALFRNPDLAIFEVPLGRTDLFC
jgi:hypothetical protein